MFNIAKEKNNQLRLFNTVYFDFDGWAEVKFIPPEMISRFYS